MSSILSSLKLTSAKRQQLSNPIEFRRQKLSNKLKEQVALAVTKDEYSKLHNSIRKHADYLETRDKLQHQHARELYDYVIFGTNTGMRVGELNACRFCDVRIVVEKLTDKKILVISNIKGKRGVGNCQSFYGAVDAFLRIVKRS